MKLHSTCLALALAAGLSAQTQPRLRTTAAASLGLGVDATILFDLFGPPAAPFALLLDLDGGPTFFAGETLSIGFTPAFAVPFSGPLDSSGFQRCSLTLRPQPTLIGRTLYSQAIVLSAGAPNGFFAPSNGESTAFFGTATAIVERFDDADAEGYLGTFDRTETDALVGTYSTRRVQPVAASDVLDAPMPGAVAGVALPFGGEVKPPLDRRGSRGQFVYRRQDLGTDGTPELLTKILWRVLDGGTPLADAFVDVSIRMSHTTANPNYSLGSFTALPLFPNSGLASTFAANPSSPEVLVRSGPYALDPIDLVQGFQPSGRYFDYEIEPVFVYNGVDSLLIDVRTSPSPLANGANGAQVYLAVPSTALPGSRNVAALPVAAAGTIDPDLVPVGTNTDNAVHDVILEFARIEAEALSPFRPAGIAAPDYGPAILGALTPGNSRIEIEYRGADDALGANPTAFDSNIDLADGKSFLQFTIRLIADNSTGAVPRLDTLVVPVR